MKYRMFRKEVEFQPGTIVEFEGPENLSHIKVMNAGGPLARILYVSGLETFGDIEYPKKKFKLMVLREDSIIEHTVDYEPKTIDVGNFISSYCETFYCFILS